MEIHKSDQVMRQFGWRQNILPPLQDIEALHKSEPRGMTGLLSTPTQQGDPMSASHPGVFFVARSSPTYYAPMTTLMPTYPPTTTISGYYSQSVYATLYTYSSI
ncbi:hypothetical protein Gorai_014116, partial [Gossypium raimondii]|nr:hypothetical protein [Gossypium raimondii]